MRLTWSPLAIGDRDDIFTYIAADNPTAAIAIDERVADAVMQLTAYPQSGRAGRVEGTRELVITGTPYIAVYSLTADAIRVLRVLNGAQQWPD